jgi:hypothetical protein
MSRQVSPSTAQVYGLLRVTRLWGVSRATLYRHRRPTKVAERKRPGPLGAMADEDLVVAIRQLLTDSPFHARVTASCGRGCASPVSAPAAAVSCG